MPTEEAVPDVSLVPPCPLVIEKGRPIFSNQCAARFLILKPFDDAVQGRLAADVM